MDAMLQAVILHLSFCRCFELFVFIIPTLISNMIKIFWITIIKIIITKINIIKGYTIKTDIFNKAESKSPKNIQLSRKISTIKFFKYLIVINQSGTYFNASRQESTAYRKKNFNIDDI